MKLSDIENKVLRFTFDEWGELLVLGLVEMSTSAELKHLILELQPYSPLFACYEVGKSMHFCRRDIEPISLSGRVTRWVSSVLRADVACMIDKLLFCHANETFGVAWFHNEVH